MLVADDDATNRLVIRAMIERFGHAVDAVANGMEAVAAVSATRYDVVLMDVMMPTMDGISATLAIRSLDGPASLVPILGLTGHNSRDQHAALRRSGMTRVITKPVTSKDLGAALSAAVNTGERGS